MENLTSRFWNVPNYLYITTGSQGPQLRGVYWLWFTARLMAWWKTRHMKKPRVYISRVLL